MKTQIRILVILTVVVTACTSAIGIAGANTSGANAPSIAAPVSETPSPPASPVKNIDPEIQAKFGIFRHSPAFGSIPESARLQLAKIDLVNANHGNLDLAVAVRPDAANGPTIVIPAEDGICMFFSDGDGGYGGTCVSKSDALAGHVAVSIGKTTITVVPDGVRSVVAEDGHGNQSNASVADNVAISNLPNPSELKLDGAGYSLR